MGAVSNKDYKIMTYSEALGLIIPYLDELKSNRELKNFCKNNKLNYKVVQLMSVNSEKEFPDTLQNILEILGYKIFREKAFKVYNK